MPVKEIIHLCFIIGGATFGGCVGFKGTKALLTKNEENEFTFEEDDDFDDIFPDDEEEVEEPKKETAKS